MLRRSILVAALVVGLAIPVAAQAADYTSAQAITPGTNLAANQLSRSYRVACTQAGWFRLIMSDGTFYDTYWNPGTGGEDGIVIIGVATTGTPSPAGVGTVSVLK